MLWCWGACEGLPLSALRHPVMGWAMGGDAGVLPWEEVFPWEGRFQGPLVPEPSGAQGSPRARKREPLPGAALTRTWGVKPFVQSPLAFPCLMSWAGKCVRVGGSLVGELGGPVPQPQRARPQAVERCDSGFASSSKEDLSKLWERAFPPQSWVRAGARSADVTSPAPSCPSALLPATLTGPLPALVAPPEWGARACQLSSKTWQSSPSGAPLAEQSPREVPAGPRRLCPPPLSLRACCSLCLAGPPCRCSDSLSQQPASRATPP